MSAYTWCRTNKGPQNEWLHRIGKAASDRCKCGDDRGTRGGRVPELEQWRPRRAVWKEWREALGGRAVSKKEAEEEGDLLGAFFYRVYEFLFSFSNPPPIVHRLEGMQSSSFLQLFLRMLFLILLLLPLFLILLLLPFRLVTLLFPQPISFFLIILSLLILFLRTLSHLILLVLILVLAHHTSYVL